MLKRFGLGLGIGYVLGARAGERRYDQLAATARRAAEAAGLDELLDRVPEVARDGAGRAFESLKERARAVVEGEDDEERSETDEGEDPGETDEGEDPGETDEGEDPGETEPEGAGRDASTEDEAGRGRQQARRRAGEKSRPKEGEDPKRRQGSNDRQRRPRQESPRRRSLVSSVAEIASTAMERGKVA